MEFKLTLPSEPKSRTGLMTSLNNALKLLKQFTLVTPVLGVSELAARLDLNKATVFNMLKTFEAHGLVVQEPKSKKYMLGPAIIELAGTKLAQDDLPQVSRRYLAQLSSETRETAHLATLYESEVLYLDKVDSPQPVRVAARIGGIVPLHCTANGKVLLAYQADDVIDRFLQTPLTRYTTATIVDPVALRAELIQIRGAGFCAERGQYSPDTCGIAAAIFRFDGDVSAAIAISGPSHRLTEDQVSAFVPLIVSAAGAISSQLGYKT